MTQPEVKTNWYEANQRYLMASLAVVREALEHSSAPAKETPAVSDEQALQEAAALMPEPPALDLLCAAFGLSSFERDLLLLCAGPELDSRFAACCAVAQRDPARAYPTFSLALAALPGAHWSALSPGAALRRWRLIEVGSGSALTTSPLRIDERALHYLTGVQHLDERLAGIVEAIPTAGQIIPSHQSVVERVAGAWSLASSNSNLPVIQLCGAEASNNRAIAFAASESLGLRLSVMSAQSLPPGAAEMDGLIRLWERESVLANSALLVECGEIDSADPARERLIARFIDSIRAPLVIATRERRRSQHRTVISFDVKKPTAREQREIWQSMLGERSVSLNGQVDALVSQFSFSPRTIRAASAEALSMMEDRDRRIEDGGLSGADDSDRRSSILAPQSSIFDAQLPGLLWEACRGQARAKLDDLAQHVEPAAGWDDLVLPELQRRTLHDIATHLRHRATVYDAWGFGSKGARGLGISALFAGASGTGKTMAAEVLAGELRLDLYRIDLSSVVSKYIGETEKNLRRVFDAAEEGGAILLFDEADALFGKRSEVKDSHDRYANIEVSYLLQRMETYRGLAILTTNLKSALDGAFLRRLRFIVQFPFPDASQRSEIWQRIFPAATPIESLDFAKLARLNVAGGNIRNIALNAAFIAADSGEPVRMNHLLRAARAEYSKLEKPVTEAEIGGWV